MAAMRIIPCRLSNGRRIPVLFRDTPPQPVLLPFLYLALKRQYKAYNTIRNDLVTIKAFYDFFALDGIDVDRSELALEKMREEADGEFGSDVRIDDLEKKISGMKKSLAMTVTDLPVPVFQDSESTNHASTNGHSSVSED